MDPVTAALFCGKPGGSGFDFDSPVLALLLPSLNLVLPRLTLGSPTPPISYHIKTPPPPKEKETTKKQSHKSHKIISGPLAGNPLV